MIICSPQFKLNYGRNEYVVTYHVVMLVFRLAHLVIHVPAAPPNKIFSFPSSLPRSKNRNQSLRKSRRDSTLFLQRHRTKMLWEKVPGQIFLFLPNQPLPPLLLHPTDTSLFLFYYFPSFCGKGNDEKERRGK